MDIAIEYPGGPDAALGLWPSAVPVVSKTHAPLGYNYQAALEYYRGYQGAYGVLWMDAPNNAVYRIFPPTYRSVLAPDFRRTERGDFELVGLWSIPDEPPGDDEGGGGPGVPAEPGPFVGHPSGAR